MMSSVSAIFDTGATYSCSSNKRYFVDLEKKMFPRNLKGISKGLDIYGFGIIDYYISIEIGPMIALRYQLYYIPGLSKYLFIISPQGISTS